MTDSYKIGDLVRVTRVWEGAITAIGSESIIWLDHRIAAIGNRHDSTCTVEVLEPAYEVGAVYIDADDDVLVRRADTRKPWRDTYGETYSESYATRPLRKFVAEPGE